MFSRVLKWFRSESGDREDHGSSDKFTYIHYVIAHQLSTLVGERDFSLDDVRNGHHISPDHMNLIETLCHCNNFITQNGSNWQINIGEEVQRVPDGMVVAAEDFLEYLDLMFKGEDASVSYNNKAVGVVWNTLFDDNYFRQKRIATMTSLFEAIKPTADCKILDLGAGNGDVLLPLLTIAEEMSFSIDLNLVETSPVFINFLNRKLGQAVFERIESMKSNSLDFTYRFYNYDFRNELWDAPDFDKKFDLVILAFTSDHLSDAALVTLSRTVKDQLLPGGKLALVDESDTTVRNALRSIFAFGSPINSMKPTAERVRDILSDQFTVHQVNDDICLLSS